MTRRFGSKVQLEYIDVTDPRIDDYPDIVRVWGGDNGRLPVVTVNGRIRLSGVFSPTWISHEVERLVRAS